ncbi:MAG: transcription elongation factor GreA [Deltaproteobacteria bacterium]|nr:transcription elongation factor GreA [Deltaproteobacteria bacterium]
MVTKVHMTREGHEMLSEELRRLKGVERPAISDAIRRAREHGDISENAEYDAAKDKQGMIEARIRQIEDRLARAEVVDVSGQPPDRVRFGTTVVLEDLDSGDELTYRIVGEDEADISKGLLSVTSPVARALIGKQVEDQVQVVVPKGKRSYEIREIRFS